MIPAVAIKPLKPSILGAGTGPLRGLCELQLKPGGSLTVLPEEEKGDESDPGGLDDDDDDDCKVAHSQTEKAVNMDGGMW